MASGERNPWWRYGIVVAAPLVRLLFRVRVTGLEHVPAKGATLVAFNHVSALDGPVLAIAFMERTARPPRFLVAAEFFRRGFYGWVLRTFEQIPIRRGEGDGAALDSALEALRGGSVIAIAPEGGVNADPERLQRIRSGVARLALPTGAAIVPVGIWGTQTRMPRGGIRWRRPWRPTLTLAFGPPILPEGDVTSEGDVEMVRDRVRDRLEEQVAVARSTALAR